MRVEQLLSGSAGRFAHKAAIVAGRTSHSYAELDRRSDRLAAALAGRGVRRNDRIAAYLDNSFAAVVTTFGVLKAGAMLCPVDAGAHSDGLARCLVESRASGIVTEARLASTAAVALCEALQVRLVVLVGGHRSAASDTCLSYEEVVDRVKGAVPAPAGDDSDAAVVLRKIGPDGRAVMEAVSHVDLVAAAAASVGGMPEAATVSTTLPLSSQHGLYHLLTAIRAGSTQVLESPATGRAPVLARDADFRDVRLALA